MPKFICPRDAVSVGGHQEFMVVADTIGQAKAMFKAGKGELVADETEITSLDEYDLDQIWED